MLKFTDHEVRLLMLVAVVSLAVLALDLWVWRA